MFWTLAVSTLLSFGISAAFFVPSVYGFLNNIRPPYDQSIPWFDLHDHLLFTSRVYLLPVIFLICMFLVPLYRNRWFFMFTSISVLLIVFHYSPKMASVFNGFQHRNTDLSTFLPLQLSGRSYHHQAFLANRVEVEKACGLRRLDRVSSRSHLIRTSKGKYGCCCIYRHRTACDQLVFLVIHAEKRQHLRLFSAVLIVVSLLTAGVYQQGYLSERSNIKSVSDTYLNSEAYAGHEQMKLIQQIQSRSSKDPLARIDWMNGVRNNTPLFEGFQGMSAYSSILNQHLLNFYWNDLQIDMGRKVSAVMQQWGQGEFIQPDLWKVLYENERDALLTASLF